MTDRIRAAAKNTIATVEFCAPQTNFGYRKFCPPYQSAADGKNRHLHLRPKNLGESLNDKL